MKRPEPGHPHTPCWLGPGTLASSNTLCSLHLPGARSLSLSCALPPSFPPFLLTSLPGTNLFVPPPRRLSAACPSVSPRARVPNAVLTAAPGMCTWPGSVSVCWVKAHRLIPESWALGWGSRSTCLQSWRCPRRTSSVPLSLLALCLLCRGGWPSPPLRILPLGGRFPGCFCC